jgi:hypothetical protein
MRTIPAYVQVGDSLDDARMSDLFSYADYVASIALDNRSLLYLQGTDGVLSVNNLSPYLGPAFVWFTGTPDVSAYWTRKKFAGTPVSYDHSVFTAAVAAMVPYTGVAGSFPTVAPAPAKKVLRTNPIANSFRDTAGITASPACSPVRSKRIENLTSQPGV